VQRGAPRRRSRCAPPETRARRRRRSPRQVRRRATPMAAHEPCGRERRLARSPAPQGPRVPSDRSPGDGCRERDEWRARVAPQTLGARGLELGLELGVELGLELRAAHVSPRSAHRRSSRSDTVRCPCQSSPRAPHPRPNATPSSPTRPERGTFARRGALRGRVRARAFRTRPPDSPAAARGLHV
jgi:hypothetical protein